MSGLLATPIALFNVDWAHLAMIVHHLAKGSVALAHRAHQDAMLVQRSTDHDAKCDEKDRGRRIEQVEKRAAFGILKAKCRLVMTLNIPKSQ